MRKSTLLLLLSFVACASVALATDGCSATTPCKTVDPLDIIEWNCFYFNRTYWTIEKMYNLHVSNAAQIKGINLLELHGLEQWPIILDYFCANGSGNTLPESDNGYTHINNYAHKSNETWDDLKARDYVTQADLYEVLAFMVHTVRIALDYLGASATYQDAEDMLECFCRGTADYSYNADDGANYRLGNDSIWYDANNAGHLNRFPGENYIPPNATTSGSLGSATVDAVPYRDRFLQNFRICMWDHRVTLSDYNTLINQVGYTDIADCIGQPEYQP